MRIALVFALVACAALVASTADEDYATAAPPSSLVTPEVSRTPARNATSTATGCEACCGGGDCAAAFRGTPGTCCGVLGGDRSAAHRREYLRRGDVLPSGRRLPLSTRERALRRWRGPTRLAVVRSLLPPHPLCLPRDVLLRVLPPPVPATATRAVLRRRDPAGTLPHPDRWLPGSAAAARIRRLEPRRGWCVSLLRPSSTTESTPDTIRADVPSDVPFGHSQPVRDTASASAVHDMKVVTATTRPAQAAPVSSEV